MSLKDAIVKSCDWIVYALFLILIVFSAIIASVNILHGLYVFVVGWILCSLTCGLWIVLSNINENLAKLVKKGE